MKPRVTWSQKALIVILGTAVVGSTIAVARRDYSFFDPLVAVKAVVSQRYVDVPDEAAMQLGAINGMLEVLNDPYTEYVPPTATREFNKDLTGDFVGIGVSIVTRDGWLTVVTPLEDTPAFRAGIMPDDRIVEINGKSTQGLTGDECVALLTGEPGTDVGIVVERGAERMPITITRERIIARTVKGFHWEKAGASGTWKYLIDPARKIAYVRLTQFTPTSAGEFAEALTAIGADHGEIRGLVFDLRFNPGGVLGDAIEIADLFLKEGVIVSTKGRAVPEEVSRAVEPGTLPDFPIAVLVNGASASASEIVSGALAENNRAIVVGTRTFGKGLVQAVVPIPQSRGAQLKITEQRYYLPSGRSLNRGDDSTEWGVDPTDGFYVPMTDEQLVELVRARRQEEQLGRTATAADQARWSDPEWIVDYLKDPQLAAAIKAVQARIDTGAWTPTGQPTAKGGAIAGDELRRLRLARERFLRDLARLERRVEALETNAVAGAEPAVKDFWDDAIDLAGGRLQVLDKDGKPVATLKITGNNLERWLIDADVEKD